MACVRHVAVVGGGIGGLALARACAQRGIRATVVERGPLPGEIGAGIGLWANALRVLDALGLGEPVRALGVPITRGSAHDRRGRSLGDLPVRPLSQEGHALYIVHRAELHARLAEALPAEWLRDRTLCRRVSSDARRAVAHSEGGDLEADLVVGADGLRSVVREAILGSAPPRYDGETCWRGIAHGAHDHLGWLREIQGPGARAGICPIDEKRVYWWATHLAPEGEETPLGRRVAGLVERFRGWPFGLPELLARTPEDTVLRHDLYDRPPVRRWHRGRLVLLGDAAHPTTPNLGQGGCMALEDAAVLAHLLHAHHELEAALRDYERLRRPRTRSVVRQSRLFGRMGRVASPIGRPLVETALRLTPRAWLHRRFAALVRYDAFAEAARVAPAARGLR